MGSRLGIDLCRICSQEGEELQRGLCGQCFHAYSLALREIVGYAQPMARRLRTFGDETGQAAADAYANVVSEARRRLRGTRRRTRKGEKP